MIFKDESEIKERIEELTGRVMPGPLEIKEDTTQYMSIHGGMIVRLGGNDYLITGDATEGRFGIEDQPKFWVKYAVDLETGARKIIKLVFYEYFTSRVGPFLIKGSRNPQKEADVLDVVRGHPNFMQGRLVHDAVGNVVRVIDFVRGSNFYNYINDLEMDHETYFFNVLPAIMKNLVEAFEAIDFLARTGQHHGDVRTDHIIIEAQTGKYVWIDFDFEVSHADFDLWSLGSVLVVAVGKGRQNYQDVMQYPELYPAVKGKLVLYPDDFMLFHKNMIADLRKLFPYIPEKLNQILINFSEGSTFFYENISSLIEDIREVFP